MNITELIDKYPTLFPDGKCMCGVCINDGWIPLVDKLCADIVQTCEIEGEETPVVQQVKEKFGGLRFYIDFGTDAVYNLIDAAERHSYKVCELCEEPGALRNGSWLVTLCNTCHDSLKQ